MEGEEVDEGLADVDDTAHDEFTETVIATKFTIKLLLSKRAVHRAMTSLEAAVDSLNQAFMAEPEGDHSHALEVIRGKEARLSAELETTDLADSAPLITQTTTALRKSYLVQAKMAKRVTPDAKPTLPTDRARGGYKVATLSVPKFSGKLRDWHSFWNAFKETIHDSPEFSKMVKLSYLREAQKDDCLYKQLSRSTDDEAYYDQAVAELKEQFDKPRTMHGIYLDNVLNMGPVKPTRSSLMSCANTLRESLDGLIRLKQLDAYSIFTSLAIGNLPEKLRMAWEEKTEDNKNVPSVEELIAFLRKRADNPLYADKAPSSSQPSDKKPFKQQQQSRHKGSVHVASSQPTQSPSQQPEPQSQKTPGNGRSQSTKYKGQSFLPCRYTCPGCSEAHYAYSCRLFREKTVAQRKEYVRTHSLCSNWGMPQLTAGTDLPVKCVRGITTPWLQGPQENPCQ